MWVLIVLGLLVLVFVMGVVLWFEKKDNAILKQAIEQQEQIIKKKEEQIQLLQEQLEALRKEQVLKEKRIVILKQKREQVQKPQTVKDLVKAFKELGYDARVK
ncbi:TPA: hypothetical protein [Aquificae Conch Spring virus]|nr:TPA: hypothetical protein [Aquificae Conch Spring virus]